MKMVFELLNCYDTGTLSRYSKYIRVSMHAYQKKPSSPVLAGLYLQYKYSTLKGKKTEPQTKTHKSLRLLAPLFYIPKDNPGSEQEPANEIITTSSPDKKNQELFHHSSSLKNFPYALTAEAPPRPNSTPLMAQSVMQSSTSFLAWCP